MAPAMSLASPTTASSPAFAAGPFFRKGREHDAPHPEDVAHPEIAEGGLGLRHLSGSRGRRSQLPSARDRSGAGQTIGQSRDRQAGGGGRAGGQDESAACERFHLFLL